MSVLTNIVSVKYDNLLYGISCSFSRDTIVIHVSAF